MEVSAPRPKIVSYGLVRDKAGKPVVDEPNTLHPIVVSMMTDAERAALGLPTGIIIRDAYGLKYAEPVSRTKRRITAKFVGQITAAQAVYLDGAELLLTPSFDVPPGEVFTITLPPQKKG